MATIFPFRAFRYSPSRIDVASVVTQPYDKITPEMQERYYAASPYNLVRIILGKREAADGPQDNPYTRAAACFRDWRREGVLAQDSKPSIYPYSQTFTIPGSENRLTRRGFIALGQLEDYGNKVVFRHEQTLAKPKADRLDLLRATKAHFGQIFMLYHDPKGEVDPLLPDQSLPDVTVKDEYGVEHCLWRVSDEAAVASICGQMRDKKLIIADGHHRYETALNYRNECRARTGTTVVPDAPYERVMMTFINMDSPGLLILPTHRVVYGLSGFSADNLKSRARGYFSVEEVDPAIDPARATGILKHAGRSGTAMLGVTAERAFLFDRPNSSGAQLLSGLSLRQQELDVILLHKYLLEGVLGLSEESIRNQTNIHYLRDTGEALARVRRGQANVAFLMNPVQMPQMRDIAFASEVMPQKSTDFYPKLLSGLTIYGLE
jgi:uncharacterized protein (DUF1015 family)